MGVYIKNWSLADWKELLKWAKIGANNAMIGEFAEIEEVPPHGRLIDADALKEVFCGNCFADEKPMECSEPCMDMRIILEAPTIIPADKEGEG